MAQVTGMTAERMLQIEAESVVDGDIVGDNLILSKRDGTTVNAGNVRGPQGTTQITPKLVGDLPSTYPTGVTAFTFGAENPGWPAGLGTVFSYIENIARGFQFVSDKTSNKMYFRVVNQDVWGAWQRFGGIDWATDTLTISRLRLTATNDVSPASTDHAFQIGATTGANIVIDGNEIMARDNGVGKRVYMEYGSNSDSTLYTPTDPGDFTHKKFVDDLATTARVQRSMTGGGVRVCTSGGISWSQRFITMGVGSNSRFLSGFFEISMPADGTVIPIHNSAAASTTVVGGIIPLNAWHALYYELPFGAVATSQPGRFHIVYYSGGTSFEVPNNWVLVCVRNIDTRAHNYMWGDGRAQDYWKTLTLTGGWLAYGSSWMTPSWRFMTGSGKIELTGLMKSGGVGAANAFATFAAELAPPGSTTSGLLFTAPASGGNCRLDVYGNGQCLVASYTSPATNAFVSLEGISWYPNGT